MNELQIVEYEGIRVVTTKQIAEIYGTSAKIVSNNFNANKKRYIERKHYFALTGEEKREFIKRPEIRDASAKTNKLYLWTQRGALLLAKSINTNIAWDAYERLVDFYFDKQTAIQSGHYNTRQNAMSIPEQSMTKLPMRTDWYRRNKDKIQKICNCFNIKYKYLYHILLEELGQKYDLAAAREIYKKERGYYPEYAIDIVGYFPELAREADNMLDFVVSNLK